MNESTKAQTHWRAPEKQATQGNGIDIGCGPDPVTPAPAGLIWSMAMPAKHVVSFTTC